MHGPLTVTHQKKTSYAGFVLPFLVFALFLGLLSFLSDLYLARLAALVAFWTALGMSWNLIGGYAGQLSLGHAAFVGLGAYITLILQQRYGLTPWLGMFASTAVAGLAALFMGIPTLRLSGTYFSLATLAYPLIFQILFTYWGYQESLIPAQPNHPWWYMQWIDPRYYAVIFAVIVLGCWIGTLLLERSRLRYSLVAIREDEAAAASVGINILKIKLWVFVVSGAIAGMLGTVYGQMLLVVAPESVFGLHVSVQALVSNFVGGVGRVTGPLLGTLITVPVSQALEGYFGHFSGVSQFVFGIILIATILVMPYGLIEAFEKIDWPKFGPLGRRIASIAARTSSAPTYLASSQAAAVAPRRPPPVTQQAPLLTAAGLGKTYHGVVALDGITFDIREGEFVGIVGPNGAGKTTLFDLLTGFQRPSSGNLRLAAENVTGSAPNVLSDRGVRRTFQVPRPFGRLTARENVMLGALRRYAPGEESAEEAASYMLNLVGLSAFADRPASSLGPSQLRLLEIARALAGNPVLLLLDEPLAGLDPSEVVEVLNILRAQHKVGLTIVLVDHDVGAVAKVVDRLIVIDNGKLIADGAPDAVTKMPRVIEAYLGRKWANA